MNNVSRLFCSKRSIALACVAGFISLLGTSSAFAHAQLIKSNPANKAELKQAPAQVELWFNELLDNGFNSIEVIPAAELPSKTHANFAKGDPKVDAKDRTHISVELQPLKPGEYVVQYRILSRDGHTATGRVAFRLVETK